MKPVKIINRQTLNKKKNENIQSKKLVKQLVKPTPRESRFDYVEKWDTFSAIITFAIPFVVVLSTNINNSLAMIAILIVMLPIETILNFCLVQKLGIDKWIAATITVIVGVFLASTVSLGLQTYTSISTSSFGIYIHLFAAYPVLYAVFYGRVVEKLSTVFILSIKNVVYFSVLTIFVGSVRELLARNTLWDIPIEIDIIIKGANLPFFGFIVMGMILALVSKINYSFKKKQDEELPPPSPEQPNKTNNILL